MTSSGWQPAGALSALQHRAAMLAAARGFFADRSVLEVETPILGKYPTTDTFIASMREEQTGAWLRSSPEHHMKRLLAAGASDIYQIGKVFRGGERGSRHEPEFTMAEWYRLGHDLDQMIAETCDFIRELAAAIGITIDATQVHDYSGLFQDVTGCELQSTTNARLQELACSAPGYSADLGAQLGDDRPAWLDFVASHLLYPALPVTGLQVVRDFPAEQAMLARLHPQAPHKAERFEVFCGGLELANGFRELQDAAEQSSRFAADNRRRKSNNLPELPPDEALLAALAAGLPDCSGVAVGIDRVLLIAGDYDDISATLSFRAAT